MNLEAGQQVGDYQILGLLGGGGMGKVYKVQNVLSGRIEAMKVLLENLRDNPEVLDRFLREIRVVAALEHPNVAALRTAQRLGHQILMIMELVEGVTIQNLVRQGRIARRDAIRYLIQVLSALSYAHKQGVVHRDVKPANMMLNAQGQIKLMDFGIARLVSDRQMTRTGLTLGSIFYMSPEQISGGAIDARSDIYSCGISLYEMATGKRPFEGDSDFAIMAAHVEQAPVPPIQIDPSLPTELNQVILMAIEKDPARRFQSADAMKNALERILQTMEPTAAGAQVEAAPAPAQPAVGARPAAARLPAAAAVPAPAPQAAGSRRGLYILAGSLLTLFVLVVAAIQLPFWKKTEAVPAGAEPKPQVVMPGPSPAVQPAPAATSEPPRSTPEPATQAPTPRTPQVKPPAVKVDVSTPKAAPADVPVQTTAPPVQQQPPASVGDPGELAYPAPKATSQTALRETRRRLLEMATRVGAVRSSLDNLRRSQAQMGVGLRGDIVSTEQRLLLSMDEAEANLKAGNADDARQHLDEAELSLRSLERFLGR